MLTGGGKRDLLFHGLSIMRYFNQVYFMMIRIFETRNYLNSTH